MKKRAKTVLGIIIVLVVMVGTFVLVAFACNNKAPEEYDFSDKYVQKPQPAESVTIFGQPNVRSEPIVCDDKDSGSSNSYGTKKIKTTFMFRVSEVAMEYEGNQYYTTYDSLDSRNGSFFGIYVEDITAINGWEEIFPESITKDPDGIVWINHNYISVSWAPHD